MILKKEKTIEEWAEEKGKISLGGGYWYANDLWQYRFFLTMSAIRQLKDTITELEKDRDILAKRVDDLEEYIKEMGIDNIPNKEKPIVPKYAE